MFWFALADTQWTLGRLEDDVKERALSCLENGGDAWRWEMGRSGESPRAGKSASKIEGKAQPPRSRRRKCRSIGSISANGTWGMCMRTCWQDELAKEHGLAGRYLLLQKVDERTYHPGHIIPIVYVRITEDWNASSKLWKNLSWLEYVQTGRTRWEERFWPIDGSRPEEDIFEKSQKHYEVDEKGFLPKFRVTLISTSAKSIPSKLIYIANYKNVTPPSKEFIPSSNVNLPAFQWKYFENAMVERYCIYHE